ncbi:MAG: hypothetical protein ACXVB9_06005 [Bdellovibrionota bacterium]
MKNVIVTCLVSMLATVSVFAADFPKNGDEAPFVPSLCGMSFEAEGGGVQILVGDFVMKGRGVIKCTDVQGHETRMPVNVQIGGKSPVALKVAMGWFKVAGVGTGVGYAKSPQDLLGHYLTVNAEGAFLVGAGAKVAMHLKRNADAATLNVGIQGEEGFGFNVGFNSLTITAIRQ